MRQKERTGSLGRKITCRHSAPHPCRPLRLPPASHSSPCGTLLLPSVQHCGHRSRDCQTPWGKDALPFIIAFSFPVHQAQATVPPGLVCLQRMWKVAHGRGGCCWEVAVGCVWNGRSPRETSNMRPVDILGDALPQLHCPFRSWTQFYTKAFRFISPEWPSPESSIQYIRAVRMLVDFFLLNPVYI